MAKRLSSVLGVDIGSRKIKVAEVRTQGGEPMVSALGMIDTPEGAVDHTGVFNAEAVGIALKQAISQAGASASHVVVSIAGQASVLVRTLEVPRMSPAELSEHMQWEINRNIPFAESNVLSDFKQLDDEDPSSPNMEVVMAISPESAIQTVNACIKKAGKTTAAIDVEALGLARSLKVSYDDLYHDKTVCIVDVGHLTTSINIYKNGRLLLPRQVPVGGEMFTKAISDAMGVGMEEAELLKQQKCHVQASLLQAVGGSQFNFGSGGGLTQEFQPYNPFAEEPAAGNEPAESAPAVSPEPFEEPTTFGDQAHQAPAAFDPFATADRPADPAAPSSGPQAAPVPILTGSGDPESQRISGAVVPVLDEFVVEVRRSLDYFQSHSGSVDQIVISGGGSKLSGLSDTLFQALGMPVASYDPLRHISVQGKRIESGFVDEHRADFAVAVGNGLHIFFE